MMKIVLTHRAPREIFASLVACAFAWGSLASCPSRAAAAGNDFNELKQGFLQPAGQARARVCYAIPRGGWDMASLTRDLQSMKDMGLGGAWYLDGYEGHASTYGNLSYFGDKEGEDFMSPAHLRKLNEYLEEASTRDLQIIPPIRALWLTGGPWVDEERAVKEYTLSKTYVHGSGRKRIRLPDPYRRQNYYRDAFVVAWPVTVDPRQNVTQRLRPVVTVNQPESERERVYLTDGNPLSEMNRFGVTQLPYGPRHESPTETIIGFEFPSSIAASGCFIKISPDKTSRAVAGTIFGSEDGVSYRKLAGFQIIMGHSETIALPGQPMRWFRVVFPPLLNRETLGVAEIEFLEAGERPLAAERIEHFDLKAARACWDSSLAVAPTELYGANLFFRKYALPAATPVIRQQDVLLLPVAPDEHGYIDWDVPDGTWCIMRLGYTLARNNYVHARRGGAGYESDIYSAESARLQYENVPARVLRGLSLKAKNALQGFWCESFELGPTNWTPRIADEFRKYAGYEMASWLPVLADEVVESTERSDAFLADFRGTLHSLYAENFHGELKRLCEKDGLEWYCETGFTRQAHQDDLAYLSRTHVPAGEFWGGQEEIGYSNTITEFHSNVARSGNIREVEGQNPWWAIDNWTKLPASVSHTVGNSQRVAVEALTGADFDFHRVPAFDKHVSDRAFCQGANQFYVSWWFNDPREDVFPGLHNWGWLNPRNPVFRQSVAFFDYVSRCQSLLQRGHFKADVLIGAETALHLTQRTGSQDWPKVFVPKGYDFDFLGRELLLEDLKVEGRELVLSSGMRYRLLQVPDFANRMSVAGLKKLEALLQSGATIMAPKPEAGLTGLDYADGRKLHRELVDRIWGGLDGQRVTSKGYGKGTLYWGMPLEEVLKREDVRPDFTYQSVGRAAHVDHIHRRIDASDIDLYFLANAVNEAAEVKARFRGQAGKTPHLFDPLNGTITPILHHRADGDDMEMPLRFTPVGSLFVVFTIGAQQPHIKSIVAPNAHTPLIVPGTGGKIMAEVRKNGTYRMGGDGGQMAEVKIESVPETIPLRGPWQVSFRDMFGATFEREFRELRSFAASDDPQVKYFSGEASYRTRFTLPTMKATMRWYLDCGDVRWLAEVKINGKKAGIVWCPPWRLDVTEYCQTGENTIEIVSANPWKNRLIGDARLPASERKTTITNFRTHISQFETMRPMEAGLLGPVTVVPAVIAEVSF